MTVNGTYRPVTVWGTGDSTTPPAADSLLWRGDGAGAEAYWRSNGTSFVSTPVPSVDVSAKVVPLASGIDLFYAPYDVDGLFIDDETGVHFDESSLRPRTSALATSRWSATSTVTSVRTSSGMHQAVRPMRSGSSTAPRPLA